MRQVAQSTYLLQSFHVDRQSLVRGLSNHVQERLSHAIAQFLERRVSDAPAETTVSPDLKATEKKDHR